MPAFRPPVRPNVAARRPVLPQIPTKPIDSTNTTTPTVLAKQEEVKQPITAAKQQAAQKVEESEYEYGSEEEETK